MAINKDNRNGTAISDAALMPAKIMTIAAKATKPLNNEEDFVIS
jgi:hypothetical protein